MSKPQFSYTNLDKCSDLDAREQWLTLNSDLDLQVSYPIVYPQNITNIQVDDYYWNYVEGRNRTQGFLNTFLDAIDGVGTSQKLTRL